MAERLLLAGEDTETVGSIRLASFTVHLMDNVGLPEMTGALGPYRYSLLSHCEADGPEPTRQVSHENL